MTTIVIDDKKFNKAHAAFKKWILKASNGVSFVSFDHPFLYSDEIRYKHAICDRATEVLQLEKWDKWKKTPGNILQAVREACNISGNLLEHRYGAKGNSDSSLYLITDEKTGELEKYLFDFFRGDSEIEARFDNLAGFVQKNKLGSKWPFFCYLAFLYNPHQYFPIHPGPFDRLLKYYEVNESISRKRITWNRYSVLLDLAEVLKEKLAVYGPINAIEIQSYMWVVSYLVKDNKVVDVDAGSVSEVDFAAELNSRLNKAKERERIGLLGEQFVFEQEKKKIGDIGLDQLVNKIKLVSFDGNGNGYDILSFDEDGYEIHIEVKTTTRSPSKDNGFWLSNNERMVAGKDKSWCVYRVWNIDTQATYENLGNIVLENNQNWELKVSGWYVEYNP